MNTPKIKISTIFSDKKLGVWLMIAGAKEMLEVRVTKSGLLHVGKPQKTHSVFSP